MPWRLRFPRALRASTRILSNSQLASRFAAQQKVHHRVVEQTSVRPGKGWPQQPRGHEIASQMVRDAVLLLLT